MSYFPLFFGCLATKHVTNYLSLLHFNSYCLKNNNSKSYCYISSGFGEKEGGEKRPPQCKVSKKSPSTNRVNIILHSIVRYLKLLHVLFVICTFISATHKPFSGLSLLSHVINSSQNHAISALFLSL